MKVSKLLILAIVLSFAFCGVTTSLAQEKMSMDDYNAQLAEWQAREAKASAAADECAKVVAGLESEINELTAAIDAVWSEIYAEIGTDKAAVDAYRERLVALDSQVSGLLALSPEALFQKRDEIAEAEEKLAKCKTNRISALTEMQNLIATIEGKLTQIHNKMPKAIYDEYNVVVGDYLWKISGKADVYSDPMQWMRIYSYNKDQIKNPDLIYPDQVFKIQREVGPEEYLVAKGDYLVKIAGNADVMGDPGSWTKLYEKNKDILGEDPNLIFPYTVLVVPK